MIYRVLKLLSTGHEPGDCVLAERFRPEIVDKLVAVGALAPVKGPPLAEIQGWKRRAEILAEVGILTAVDFLHAPDEALQEAFGHKTNRAVIKYKQYLRDLLEVRLQEPDSR